MFNLEKSLSTWRHQYAFNRLFDLTDVDELERHIRDQVEFLCERGYSEEDAYRKTIDELGNYSETESEYRKILWSKLRHHGAVATEVIWNIEMLKNYLLISLRTLAKNRAYSFINIAGLTVGMACCLVIYVVVQHETQYDQFHSNADEIYRVNVHWQSPEFDFENALTSAPFAPTLEATFPAIEQSVRLTPNTEKVLLRAGNTRLYALENRMIFADPSVFDIFSFGFQGPNAQTALSAPFTVVLTRGMAKKLYPNEDPIGKSLRINDTRDYEITGLVDDVPPTAHFTAFPLRPGAQNPTHDTWTDYWEEAQ